MRAVTSALTQLASRESGVACGMRRPTPLLLLLGLLCVSCNFVFARGDGVTPGEVRGRALRLDVNEPASYARISMNGANVARRALADGTFSVGGLSAGALALRIDDDPDGDGWPDRGGYAAALLSADAAKQTTFVLLGDVALNGVMLVQGTVSMEAGGAPAASAFIARAYVTRGLCFDLDGANPATTEAAACPLDLADRVETGAEAATSADALGAFQFDGVLPGDIEVAVVLYQDAGGALGSAVAVQGPFRLSGNASEDPPGIDVVFPTPAPLGTRPVQVQTSPAAGADSVLLLSEPGRLSSCASVPPIDDLSVFALGGGEVQLALPLGIWDVTVCDGGIVGRAFAQAALAPAVEESIPRWRVALFVGDACTRVAATDALDCDGDGLAQLPVFDEVTAELWEECSEQCAALGEALGDKTCSATVAGGEQKFDCDDDADGQSDTTEIAACIGAGLGNDLDGDRICSTNDPFPQCTANAAGACPAGTNDVAPESVVALLEPLPKCGTVAALIGAFNGNRDLQVIGDQLYVVGSSGVDRLPLDIVTGVASGGALTVQNLVNFEEMSALLLDGDTLFTAGGPLQPNAQTEPSRLWLTNVAVPAAPATTLVVDLAPASTDLQFAIPELDAAVISSRFVAANASTVFVIEHTTGGDVIALDRASLESGGGLDVVGTVDFAAPIDARGALVVGSHLAIVSANGDAAGGPSMLFLDAVGLVERTELALAAGTVGAMAANGSTLFIGNAGAVRAFDLAGTPAEIALPPSFAGFHVGADVRGLALLDANMLVVGSSTPELETHLTMFNLDTRAPVAFTDLVDQAGFGTSSTEELTVLGGRFVYPAGRASAAPQQVFDLAACPRQ